MNPMYGGAHQSFAVVQPAVAKEGRWTLSVDSLPAAPGGGQQPPYLLNLWVCIDSDVWSMTPQSPNPSSTVYVIYQTKCAPPLAVPLPMPVPVH